MSSRGKQTDILFSTHGGRRRGAGRKPKGARPMVTHRPRPKLSGREPVLVTMKVRPEISSLRSRRVLARVLRSLSVAKVRLGARIVHFSVQKDHAHLIVEPVDRVCLSRAMQGLAVRIAKALNKLMDRCGKVFADRFHSRVLAKPKQVRHALAYVLCNARKHGVAPPRPRWLDPCSSARAFDGWKELAPDRSVFVPVADPLTWLLKVGWRRRGLIDPDHTPGSMPE